MILGRPTQLSGPAEVVQLRAAMKALAVRLPGADPGPAPQGVYGGVNEQMINALIYLTSRISMPSELKVALVGASLASSMSTSVRAALVSVISKLASTLTVTVKAYNAKLALGGGGSGAGVRYPAGSIQAKIGSSWHIAIPVGSTLGESVFMIEGPDLEDWGGGNVAGGGHGGGGHHGGGGGRWHGGGYYPAPYYIPTCMCPTLFAPVIATDGRVYDNDCLAACAGVAVVQRLPSDAKISRPGFSGAGGDVPGSPWFVLPDHTREDGGLPVMFQGAGLGEVCGDCIPKFFAGDLGAADPANPVTHEEVGTAMMQQSGVAVADKGTYQTKTGTQPFYKKLWFWGTVAGVAVAGTGAYFALRR